MARRQRVVAWAAVALVVAAVGLWPLLAGRDSFPLSDYPMFASPRTASEVVDTAVVRRADGSVHRPGPQLVAGTDEVVTAAVAVSRAIGEGRTDALCRQVATRVADRADGADRGGRVEVVTERFDALAWFRGDRTPIERTVWSDCPVEAEPGR